MDRHEAYKLLCKTLAGYQDLPFGDLASLVGERVFERVSSDSGEEFLVDVRVAWADDRAKRVRVIASVDSPSTFRLERLEERIFVSEKTT